MTLIKPYYRNNRIETIDAMMVTMEERLINQTPGKEDISYTDRVSISNNVCALVLNDNGHVVYSVDSLGELCMLNKDITYSDTIVNITREPEKIIEMLKSSGSLSIDVSSNVADVEMVVRGKKIASNLANYYLLINTPLEPVESYVDFIMNQYLYLAMIAILASLLISFFLARRISIPIEKMKKEADKLADGDYDVDFENARSFSELVELGKTLDDATDKLSKIDELRKDLLANVSHDIKTPLTMIQAYAEMIRDISGDDPVKRNQHIDVILKETEYLNKLVSDMQELSKMQAGIIELSYGNFDLKETIEDVVELLNHLIESKKIILCTDLTSVTVYGDELKLSQVIYNFLSNAIKHTGEDKHIYVNMIDSEYSVKVEIKDEGEGIKEELLPYIWDRYYKVDKHFTRSKESTGLGLAIAKAILEAHHAKYGVESKVNEGSTFYFELSKDYEDDKERLS